MLVWTLLASVALPTKSIPLWDNNHVLAAAAVPVGSTSPARASSPYVQDQEFDGNSADAGAVVPQVRPATGKEGRSQKLHENSYHHGSGIRQKPTRRYLKSEPAPTSLSIDAEGHTAPASLLEEQASAKTLYRDGADLDEADTVVADDRGFRIQAVQAPKAKAEELSYEKCYELRFTKYRGYAFKLSEPGLPCEGPGPWKPVDKNCELRMAIGKSCKEFCQAAVCALKHSACTRNASGCVDFIKSDARGVTPGWKDRPGGCHIDHMGGEARWNRETPGNFSDGIKSVCYMKQPSMKGISSLILNSCGAGGRLGPTQQQCDAIHKPGLVQVIAGHQLLHSHQDSTYEISAIGAMGGRHGHGRGGAGALIKGKFQFKKHDHVAIIVGQRGKDNREGGGWGGGGGGATWIGKVVKRGGKFVAGLGLRLEVLMVGAGGAGMDSRKDGGKAKGGQNIDLDLPTRAAFGGRSGGGGGFLFDGEGGDESNGSVAMGFLNGSLGGGDDVHYGGFGGGGAPFNGGGGGGGYRGGDCSEGGFDRSCLGGTSFGGMEVVLDFNTDGDGVAEIKETQKEPGKEKSHFKATRDNGLFVGTKVDFDITCKKHCDSLQGFDLSVVYDSGHGLAMENAVSVDSKKAFTQPRCAAAKTQGHAVVLIFAAHVTRVGFYYSGTDSQFTVSAAGDAGHSQDFLVEDNRDRKPDHTQFFGIKGNGITKVSISGSDFCIDDLRWLDDSTDLRAKATRDFAGYALRAFAGLFTQFDPIIGAKKAQLKIPGGVAIEVISREPVYPAWYTNGLKTADAVKIKIFNLFPRTLYHLEVYSFEDEDANEPEPRESYWKIGLHTGDGYETVSGDLKICPFPGGDRPADGFSSHTWLPHCAPIYSAKHFSTALGYMELTIDLAQDVKDQGGILPLSGIAVYPAKGTTTTTTTKAAITYRVNESECGGFTEGWSETQELMTEDGKVHGTFRSGVDARKVFTSLPPHDIVTLSMRFWAMDAWTVDPESMRRDSGSLYVGTGDLRREPWRKAHNFSQDCDYMEGTTPDGWTPYLGEVFREVTDKNRSCAVVYTDLAVGFEHGDSTLEISLVSDLGDQSKDKYWAFGSVSLMVGKQTHTIVNELVSPTDSWTPTTTSLLESNLRVHGFFPGSQEKAFKTFVDLGKHDFIYLSMIFYAGGPWQGSDGVIKVDGIEVWRATRTEPLSCSAGRSEALEGDARPFSGSAADPALPKLPPIDPRAKTPVYPAVCEWQVMTAIPHRKAQATVEVSSTLLQSDPVSFWGFGSVILKAGGESQQCHAELCPQGYRLMDGPPWCTGECGRQTCCEKLGMCKAEICPREQGLMLMANGRPLFCQRPTCSEDECCQPRPKCVHEVCSTGWVPKDEYPEFCAGEICSREECCDKLGRCSLADCPEGYALLPGNKVCKGPQCSQQECCVQLGACDADVCGTGWKLMPSLPQFCEGKHCQLTECCHQLGVCKVSTCSRGFTLMTQPAPPAYCRDTQCRVLECCSPLGTCDLSMCNRQDGWRMKRYWPEVCGAATCDVSECCERLGKCEDTLCPVGFLPKVNTKAWCKHPRCEPLECCEALPDTLAAGVVEAQMTPEDAKSGSKKLASGGPCHNIVVVALALAALLASRTSR
eukprot:TRINITY_DN23932_c0_g1_i1.p1 TRINITY_DN23932_c0_g1~~TRINITY_DN23932_c0_g1_i1.p1  ORF type:complete len:1623 (+),score=337.03 TRINITY_DN23932_c0_g1_i1:37-4905(+)